MRRFPIDGPATFSDDFGADHRGIDIFADAGTPVVAVQDGSVRSGQELYGGNVIYLRGTDGVTYFYAHLDSYAGRFPRTVRAGDTIGTVGNTGNAVATDPHVHFEMHRPDETINPYTYLSKAFNNGGIRWPLILGISVAAALGWYLGTR